MSNITTFWEDESRTAHADGTVTYAYHIAEGQGSRSCARNSRDRLNAPSWAVFVGYTYRDGLLVSGPDFAEFRSDLIEWGPLA